MVIVAFKPGEKEISKYEELDQYDYGQILRIQGLNLPPAVEIHFALQKTGGTSKSRIGITKDGVTDVPIPDSMLENEDETKDYDIYAFIYVTDETSGQTEYRIALKVKARPKPEVPGGGDNPDIFHEAVEAVRKAMEAAAESEKQAEGWAHGREDLPERAEDNAKYYAGKAHEDAEQTATDKKEVERLVESVSGIEEQVEKVDGLTKQAQKAATDAGLYKEAAESARKGAEIAKSEAETAAGKTAEDKTAVETAKGEALKAQEAVSTDRKAVESIKSGIEQLGGEIAGTVEQGMQELGAAKQQAVQAIEQTGTAQKGAVEASGTKAVQSIENIKQTATEAVETAKSEAVQAIQAEGTTQTGNVTTEGTKQVQAVSDKGKEVLQSIPEDFQIQMESKLDKNQGTENAGKVLVVGEDGNIVPGEVQGVGESEEWLKAPVIDIEISEEIAYLYINMIDKKTFCFNEIACEFHLDGITNSSDGRLCFAPKQINAGWQGIIVANTNGSAGKIQRGFFKIKNSKLVGWHSIYMSSPIANWLDLNSDIGSHIPSESGNPFNKVNNGITEFTIIPYNGKLHPGSRFKIYGRPVKEESL